MSSVAKFGSELALGIQKAKKNSKQPNSFASDDY